MRDELPQLGQHAGAALRLRRRAQVRGRRGGQGAAEEGRRQGQRHRRRARQHARTAGGCCAPPTPSPCWWRAARAPTRRASSGSRPTSRRRWRRAASACRTRRLPATTDAVLLLRHAARSRRHGAGARPAPAARGLRAGEPAGPCAAAGQGRQLSDRRCAIRRGEVAGAIVGGLSARDVARLAAYEGPRYRIAPLKVRIAGRADRRCRCSSRWKSASSRPAAMGSGALAASPQAGVRRPPQARRSARARRIPGRDLERRAVDLALSRAACSRRRPRPGRDWSAARGGRSCWPSALRRRSPRRGERMASGRAPSGALERELGGLRIAERADLDDPAAERRAAAARRGCGDGAVPATRVAAARRRRGAAAAAGSALATALTRGDSRE